MPSARWLHPQPCVTLTLSLSHIEEHNTLLTQVRLLQLQPQQQLQYSSTLCCLNLTPTPSLCPQICTYCCRSLPAIPHPQGPKESLEYRIAFKQNGEQQQVAKAQ